MDRVVSRVISHILEGWGKLNTRSQARMRSEGVVVFSIQLVLARRYGRYSSEWSGAYRLSLFLYHSYQLS